jgi:hypothetical protein
VWKHNTHGVLADDVPCPFKATSIPRGLGIIKKNMHLGVMETTTKALEHIRK